MNASRAWQGSPSFLKRALPAQPMLKKMEQAEEVILAGCEKHMVVKKTTHSTNFTNFTNSLEQEEEKQASPPPLLRSNSLRER
jgi:hypothetical protein